jgi:hypothetical protein
MAYIFGDSWDLYAAAADMVAGYWDSSTNIINFSLQTGRFIGGQSIRIGATGAFMVKANSGGTDSVHHFVCAVRQTAALSGATPGL